MTPEQDVVEVENKAENNDDPQWPCIQSWVLS